MKTLTHKEMAGVEGGLVWLVPLMSAIGGMIFGGVTSNVLDNWGDFKQGIREGYNRTAVAI